MRRSVRFLLALSFLSILGAAQAEDTAPPVQATIDTTLATATKQIRQFAFDGDPDTYFASATNPKSTDHFTLVFDRPVAVKSIVVTTGKPRGGGDALDKGEVEVSEDGATFGNGVKLEKGIAKLTFDAKPIKAIRIRPTADMTHPLAIREIAVQSDPLVTVFKYPVEFIVKVDDAPDMKAWAEKAARVCERQYPMLCEELRSDGFKPLTMITMTLTSSYNGVAFASGGNITGSVKYFKDHPDDIGAMVHETAHCVQLYRGRNNPGWLVEGVADYVRFFKYEPMKPRALKPEQAKYNGSYRVTAAFLAFVTEKYDKEIVRKLNKAMREATYKEEIWKTATGKTVEELNQDWRASLAK